MCLVVFACLLCLPSARAAGSPPPNGFAPVAASSDTSGNNQNFGANPRIALDANGDPMVCYLWIDPNGDGNNSDTTLYFTAWSRTLNKFSAPVKVAVPGDIATNFMSLALSIARDPQNNTVGIAFHKATATNEEVHIALSSDGGNTWNDKTAISSASVSYYSPSLAMANGNVYLAYIGSFEGVHYVTGKETDAPTQWTSVSAPLQIGYSGYRYVVSLALDSNNNPALAYILASDSTSDTHLVFWRPGAPSPVLISGTQGQSADGPDIKLSFFGTQPRVAFAGAMDQNYFADYDHTLWAIRSTDNGLTWAAPVNIPSDAGSSLNAPMWLAIGSQGQGAIVSYSNSGNGTAKCGQPKLSTSDATFAKWSTCAPPQAAQLRIYALSPADAYGPNDRLYIVFQVPPGNDLPYGVNLWSSTIVSSINNGGIVNVASYTLTSTSVAPGSLVAIFGTTLSDGTVCVPDNCGPNFDSNGKVIPTMSGAQVTFNGIAAPILSTPSSSQLNVQVPVELAGLASASVQVTMNGQTSAPSPVSLTPFAPGLISIDSSGQGQGAILNDKDANVGVKSLVAPLVSGSPAHPAAAGDVIEIYMTGLGAVTPQTPTGMKPSGLPQTAPVSATIGGIPATVLFPGLANCCVGLNQVNVRVPNGIPANNAVPVVLTIGGVKSNMVTIAVGP